MRHFIKNLFLEHPASVGESYFAHLRAACSFAARMIFGGLACFIHGVFPFLCVKTGSVIITDLNQSMVTHREKKVPQGSESQQRVELNPLI
jgi:hypothetical protein